MNTQISTGLQTTDAAEQIAAMRSNWQDKLLAQQEQERETQAWNAVLRAQLHQELLDRMAEHLPGWMLEYVQTNPTHDVDTATEFVSVLLPGCCPIRLHIDSPTETISMYEVYKPLHLECDDSWWVRQLVARYYELDEAVDEAAANGESWHEMTTEAARRNELGLSPEHPPAIADPIDQARELVNRFSNGLPIKAAQTGDDLIDSADSATLVTAAVGLAIAYHVSRVADALERR